MGAPVAIEAVGVEKVFRVPEHRISSLKERAVHPFSGIRYRELHALRGVSFDVKRGEFFGIVGRNGSGKSTLLKVLASIYRADGGRIRMAGRLAPFIELGVGFDPELTARENVVLNGVMMGLSQREARQSLDAVLEFAELEEFVELKLKNYSSGMMVRLAFSVMIQADADILLIDEVLAVGDAAFQQKCADVFRQMGDSGKTIVLVTHDMFAVEAYCDRAMLLHDGSLLQLGDPEEVGRQYLRLNFDEEETSRPEGEVASGPNAAITDAWLENEAGERVTNCEQGEPLRLRAVIEARQTLEEPLFGFVLTNADGVHVSGFGTPLEGGARLEAGGRIRVEATVENLLAPGRYYLSCRVSRHGNPGNIALQALNILNFVVFGSHPSTGIVDLATEIAVRSDGAPG